MPGHGRFRRRGQGACGRPSIPCRRGWRRSRRRQRAPAGRGSDRSPRCSSPAFQGNASTTRMPRAENDASAPSSSARATPRRRHGGAMTKQTMAAASCGGTASSGGAMPRRAQACGELVIRLRVEPPDDVAAGIREEAVHLAGVDPRRHRGPVRRGVERIPGNRLRHLVVVAVALRPLRVVGEGRAALVIEKAQEIVAPRRRQAFDREAADRHPGLSRRPFARCRHGQRPALISVHSLLRSRRCARGEVLQLLELGLRPPCRERSPGT